MYLERDTVTRDQRKVGIGRLETLSKRLSLRHRGGLAGWGRVVDDKWR